MEYKSKLEQCLNIISAARQDRLWIDRGQINDTAKHALSQKNNDFSVMKNCHAVLFDPHAINNLIVSELFLDWRMGGEAPNISNIALYAFEQLCPELENTQYETAAMISGILADIPNDLPFHNNDHYREVLCQTIRMIVAHNFIYQGTQKKLSQENIALLIIAACVHDLGHQGKGNNVRGEYSYGYNEGLSFCYAEAFLSEAGLDRKTLSHIRAMIIGTDVGPYSDQSTPMKQIKRAYDFHFSHGNKTYKPVLTNGLEILENDKILTLLCLILHEADIATSAGLSYEMTQWQSLMLTEETGKDLANPEETLAFLDHVCDRMFRTTAGQRLFTSDIIQITAGAERDVENGNHAFKKPSGFSAATKQAIAEGFDKTIH